MTEDERKAKIHKILKYMVESYHPKLRVHWSTFYFSEFKAIESNEYVVRDLFQTLYKDKIATDIGVDKAKVDNHNVRTAYHANTYLPKKSNWAISTLNWLTNFNTIWDAVYKIFIVVITVLIVLTIGIRPMRVRVIQWWQEVVSEAKGRTVQTQQSKDSPAPKKDSLVHSRDSAQRDR